MKANPPDQHGSQHPPHRPAYGEVLPAKPVAKPMARLLRIARYCSVLLILLAIGITLDISPTRTVLRWVDTAELKWFAHRIATTDHVVASMMRGAVSVTITGEDSRRIVQAVTHAKPARPRPGMGYACDFSHKFTFFKGPDALGRISACGSLFLIRGTEYRDESEVLKTLGEAQLDQAYDDWAEKQRKPQ